MALDLELILNNITNPVFVAKTIPDENGKITDFEVIYQNKKMQETTGHIIQNSKKWSEFKDRIQYEIPWYNMIMNSMNGLTSPETVFYSGIMKSWFKFQISVVNKDFIVVTLTDITSERNYSQALKASLITDPLTGLLNRSGFSEALDVIMEDSRYAKKHAGVVIFDIDNMKSINESMGEKEGDKIIIETAAVLKAFQRENIKVFRYGDDEFLVLLSDIGNFDTITNIVDAIFEAFMLKNIQVSGGISIYPDNTEQKDELIRFADMALHYAKKNGRNNCTYFEPEMQRVFIQHLTLESRLNIAISEGKFQQYYQPQFDIETGKLRGFEALLRWTDEELGEISPSVFIPLAEETGMIITIGKWVLETAIKTLKKWETDYNFDGVMSVNVSPLQLNQSNFLSDFQALIQEYGINPDLLEVEITEGVMIQNMDSVIDKLKDLKEMGIRVSLDDFGTGYSSLNYLQTLPLSTLKIDKSFINNITSQDGVQANITSSIISMVSKMGLETIAEGVENKDQLDLLKKFNCNVVQGFLRGKPMPFELCDRYLSGDDSAIIKL